MPLLNSEFEILSLYLDAVFVGEDTPTVLDEDGLATFRIVQKMARETGVVDFQRLGAHALSLLLQRVTYGASATEKAAKLIDRLKGQ